MVYAQGYVYVGVGIELSELFFSLSLELQGASHIDPVCRGTYHMYHNRPPTTLAFQSHVYVSAPQGLSLRLTRVSKRSRFAGDPESRKRG